MRVTVQANLDIIFWDVNVLVTGEDTVAEEETASYVMYILSRVETKLNQIRPRNIM